MVEGESSGADLSYDFTLQRVRDLSESKLQREPGRIYNYKPKYLRFVDQIKRTEPVQDVKSEFVPPANSKKAAYMQLNHETDLYWMADLLSKQVVFQHSDENVVREWAKANGYYLA